MLRDSFLAKYIGTLKAAMNDTAHGGCKLPKADPFEHGIQAGRYQGLQEALTLLEAEIEDEAEKDKEK